MTTRQFTKLSGGQRVRIPRWAEHYVKAALEVELALPPDPEAMFALEDYTPYGGARELFDARSDAIIFSGPAGTGKSRAVFELIHRWLRIYPNARALVVRKTMKSLTTSGLVTFQNKVLATKTTEKPRWFGGSQIRPPEFEYSNGSVLVVGGMDNADKTLSTDYDIIYFQEATEGELNDWELLTRALRNNQMPFQIIIGDCNPGAPTHWILQKVQNGEIRMIESRHEDNPVLFDQEKQEWTDEGKRYVFGVLERLTGVRKDRLRYGRWVSAEGAIYEEWNPGIHMEDLTPRQIPAEWPRYWTIDFGYTNPFVCQFWAVDPDGGLHMYREIYFSQRIVEDHAADILDIVAPIPKDLDEDDPQYIFLKSHPERRIWIEPKPRKIICDHDAEDRATLEKHIGLRTHKAYKKVSAGIQAFKSRLRPAAEDRPPRILFCRDALVQVDEQLKSMGKPTCTVDEMPGYVWDTSNGAKRGELPLKLNDHGMDAGRYMVADQDLQKVYRAY